MMDKDRNDIWNLLDDAIKDVEPEPEPDFYSRTINLNDCRTDLYWINPIQYTNVKHDPWSSDKVLFTGFENIVIEHDVTDPTYYKYINTRTGDVFRYDCYSGNLTQVQ